MAEVLVKFSEPVRGGDGRLYWAQVCGGTADDGLHEGWLEFERDGAAIRTARETEQPNREDLLYWAQGLSTTYLEGALDRARHLAESPVARPPVTLRVLGRPRFDRPARADVEVPQAVAIEPRAILDPFAVFAEGEGVLRSQLNALSRDQLVNIIGAFRLDTQVTAHTTRIEVAEAIVRAMRRVVRPGADEEAAPGHA